MNGKCSRKKTQTKKTTKETDFHLSKYSVYNSSVDKDRVFGALLTDLPKRWTVLIIKYLKHIADGLSLAALRLIYDCL